MNTVILYISFSLFFLLLFGLLLYGEFLIRVGRAKEGFALYFFSTRIISTLLVIMFILYLISLLPKENKEVVVIEEKNGLEIPESPAVNFPPSPNYIEIAGYYFRGPYPVIENIRMPKEIIFSVFCKKNEKSDFLYVDYFNETSLLASHTKYSCFLDNCKEGEIEFALLYMKEEEIDEKKVIAGSNNLKTNIIQGIRERTSSVCFDEIKI